MALSGYGHADPVIPSPLFALMSAPLLYWLKWGKSMFTEFWSYLYYCSGQRFPKPPGGGFCMKIFSPLDIHCLTWYECIPQQGKNLQRILNL